MTGRGPGWEAFPDACFFCGHVRNGEGACQCPPDCPTCGQGCCGQILVDYLPHVTMDE